MPLARIITTSAKYSDGLADDLRSRGFQVLTSAPGENVSESADLEITLNECLPEEAKAAAADAPVTKDMRVFVTPQAFAGKIRSIEMFVLTSKLAGEIVEPRLNLASTAVEKILEFAAPAEAVSHDVSSLVEVNEDVSAAEVKAATASLEEPAPLEIDSNQEIRSVIEPAHSDPQSMIGRAVLASRQAAVPAWPDMAEMKLFPAELAPAVVKPAAVLIHAPLLPVKSSSASRSRAHSFRDMRFWKVPIVAAIAAVLVMSAVRLANYFSASHTQAGTFQQVTPSSVEAATPAIAPPVNNPGPASTAQSSSSVMQEKPAEKFGAALAPSRRRALNARAKQRKHHHSDSDYVAKDTTIYFSRQPADSSGDKKP